MTDPENTLDAMWCMTRPSFSPRYLSPGVTTCAVYDSDYQTNVWPKPERVRSRFKSEGSSGQVFRERDDFRYKAILHAPRALQKREDQTPMTYLNKGQRYLLELVGGRKESGRGAWTSKISIGFHEQGHREAAESYWKFWTHQQAEPSEARAVRLDEKQSTGVFHVRPEGFDAVRVDWHPCLGAKVYLQFECLSTDFSRIKGVKGIPLRVQVDTHGEGWTETCFGQIKLFRDKGAERKNKDDSKQLSRQFKKGPCSFWPFPDPAEPVTVLDRVCEGRKRERSEQPRENKRAKTARVMWVKTDPITPDALRRRLAQELLLDPERVTELVWRKQDKLVWIDGVWLDQMTAEARWWVQTEIGTEGWIRLVFELAE